MSWQILEMLWWNVVLINQNAADCTPTISDKGSTCEHLPEHELDHSQDDAHQAADDGHTEQEVVLRDK